MTKFGAREPDRLGILDLATSEGYTVQYNPERTSEKVGAEWREQAIAGLSHTLLYFANTTTHQVAFSLKFLGTNATDIDGLNTLKRFLLSLVYPTEGGSSPPDVLLIWPNSLRMVVVVTSVGVENEAFAANGTLTEFTATIECKERRTYALTSADVRRLGSQREDA